MNSYRNNSANLPGQAASNVFPSIQKTPYPAGPFCRSLVTEWNEARIRHLENVISSKEKTVLKAPAGKLRVSRSRNREQYFCLTEESPRVGRFLTRKEEKLRDALAQKDYDQKVIRAARRELDALRGFTASMPEIPAEGIYSSLHEMRKKCVSPIWVPDSDFVKAWEEESFVTKGVSDDIPEYITGKGERVRSKSEILIADLLCRLGIPYRYECRLELKNNVILYPDFTILHVPSRRILYYEHLGRMNDPAYVKDIMWRFSRYSENGIRLGNNLFLTWEMQDYPLNMGEAEAMFREFFM